MFYAFIYTENVYGSSNIFSTLESENAITEIETFLKNGGDINTTNYEGNTLLIESAKNGYYDVTEYLIEHKANIDFQNKENKTALMYSVDYIHIMKFLIDNGANIEIEDEENKTALFLASEKGNIDAFKYLIAKGSDLNKKTSLNRNILMYGVTSGNLELVKYIVEELKININELDDWGQNSMFFVSNIDIAKYLTGKNIEVNLKNIIGWSILDIAVYMGNKELADYYKSINVKSYIL